MTDGWKDALRELDDLAPSDAVYRRAAEGPLHPDFPEGPTGTKRIVAGVTAFAVFALAAGFAWRALRPSDGSVAVGPPPSIGTLVPLGQDGSTLWPENTATGLRAAQAEADAGSVSWRLDPSQVATRFAGHVLGWDESSYASSPQVVTLHADDGTITGVAARLTRYAAPCASPADGQQLGVQCYDGAEDIVMAQPVTQGAHGIWSVVTVDAPTASIEAKAGEVFANGSALAGTVEGVPGVMTEFGSFVGDIEGHGGSCNATAARGGSHGGPDVSIDVQVLPDAAAGTGCGSAPPGFVWAGVVAGSDGTRLASDPLWGGMSFVSFAAVPIVVSIPENVPTESPSPPVGGSGMSNYADPAGWSVSYPSGWSVSPIDILGKVSTQGVVIANHAGGVASPNVATPGPIGPDLGTAPSDLVAVGLLATSGGPADDVTSGDDTSLPLSSADLKVAPGTCNVCPATMTVQAEGQAYEIDLWAGRDASASDVAAAKAIIESFRAPSLRAGTITHGWTPLAAPLAGYPVDEATSAVLSGTPELQRLGVTYVMRPSSGPMYALDLVPDTCGEGQDQQWDSRAQEIIVTCPGGTVIRYDPEGRPDPGNPLNADHRLDAYRVIRSWDGQYLLNVSTPIAAQWVFHWGAQGGSSASP